MKKLLGILFTCISLTLSAQIVNIPDTAFKAYLLGVPYINTNGDSEIQLTEALATDSIERNGLGMSPVYDLTGIRSFANLRHFQFGYVLDDVYDFSGMVYLKKLAVGDNVSGNPNLVDLNISGCVSLEHLNIGRMLATADVRPFSQLRYLRLTVANNGSYYADSLVHLKEFYAYCPFTDTLRKLSVTHCDSVLSIQYAGNADTIDVSNTPQLVVAQILPSGYLKTFIARNSGMSGLQIIVGLDNNPYDVVGDLDVTGCWNLYQANLTHFKPPVIDFSSCPKLHRLVIHAVDMDNSYINLKNGIAQTHMIYSAPGDVRICADDFEINALNAWVMPNNPGNVVISPFCTLFPGGNYNLIRGDIRVDADQNGCSANDFAVLNIPVKMTNTITGETSTVTSNLGGRYAHYPYAGNFSLTPYVGYPHFSFLPAAATVLFDTADNLIDTADFCIIPNGNYQNIDVTLVRTFGGVRPGRVVQYNLTYRSRSTSVMSGQIKLNFESNRLIPGFVSETPTAQSPGEMEWNYAGLQPFETRSISIWFSALPPPVNNMGDTMFLFAQVNPIAGDETPADNSYLLPQGFTNSFDPNAKECLEGEKIDISHTGEYLHYVVYFQNMGNDTAFNVVVTDTLSNNFDWESFEFMSSSHPVIVKQQGDKLQFTFENIMLPHTAINEPASHGFVSYRIKPKATVGIGDSLNNKASIWFDFNAPVATNIATTIVTNPAGPVPVKLEYFSGTMKERKNVLTWKAVCTDPFITFSLERGENGTQFKPVATLTATNTRCLMPFDVTDDNPTPGKNYYRLSVTDIHGLSFYSKTIMLSDSRSGLQILAVANHTVYLNSDKEQSIHVQVVGADGRLMYSASRSVPAGSGQLTLPMKNLSTGIYTLVVCTGDGEVITRRFIK